MEIAFCSRNWSISSALNPSCERTSALCSPCSRARRAGTLASPRRVIGLLTVYSRSVAPSIGGEVPQAPIVHDDVAGAQLRILGRLCRGLDNAVGHAGLVQNLFPMRPRLGPEFGVKQTGQLRGVLADSLDVAEPRIRQQLRPPDRVGHCRPRRLPGRQHEPAAVPALVRIGHRVHRRGAVVQLVRLPPASAADTRVPVAHTPVASSDVPTLAPRPVRSRWYSAVVIAA